MAQPLTSRTQPRNWVPHPSQLSKGGHQAEKVCDMGDLHTQTIEGCWSPVKRGIGGVYLAVAKRLQTYLDEYTFRYNRRDQGNLIFVSILERGSARLCEKPSAPWPKISLRKRARLALASLGGRG